MHTTKDLFLMNVLQMRKTQIQNKMKTKRKLMKKLLILKSSRMF